MHKPLTAICAALFSATLLAGCGTPGAPLPPSLHLPKPVEDLQALRVGDTVHLRWTEPEETTDQQGIRQPGVTRVCRDYREGCPEMVAEFPPGRFSAGKTATAEEDIAKLVSGSKADFITYSVEALNPRGRSAGPSNLVTVFLAPALPPPADASSKVVAQGVQLEWSNPGLLPEGRMKTTWFYRVLRLSPGAGAPVQLADVPVDNNTGRGGYLDRTVDWEKSYEYRVAGLTRVLGGDGRVLYEFIGEASPVLRVNVHDVFPPATPAGLQAVSSGTAPQAFIDLTWSPNVEADLAGYNVFRGEEGVARTAYVKINPALVKTPSFRDDHVERGHQYSYQVSAVDTQNNESPRSQPANENVPQ